jgi:hypothetical protein
MSKIIALALFFLLLFACGERKEDKGRVQDAVKEAVTKEFQMYESAKKSLEKIEKESQQRREKEKQID